MVDIQSASTRTRVLILFTARHVFGTLFDFGPAYEKLGTKRQDAMRLHLTLLDHHPAMIARDLCVLMLLNQLMELEDSVPLTDITRAEIEATLTYTYLGLLMPDYCAER